MSQDSDSSASGDENQDLIEPADEETEAVPTPGLADVSASTSSNLNTSFVGKVCTKVSNILSTIFSRSPPAATASIHKQPRQLTNADSFSTIGQRKRKHSPAMSPSLIIDDRYEQMVRKRARLNVPTESVTTQTVATQTVATDSVNRNVRSATPNRFQQRTSQREIQRRLASRKLAGRGVTPHVQQKLVRKADAEPRQDSGDSVGIVARKSPAFVPSESTPVSSIERDSRADSVASTIRSVNSQSQLQDEGDSVTTDRSTSKQQQLKVPSGIRQIYAATAKVNDDPARRYSTFLGNRIYNQRQQARHRSQGGDILNFSSHLDRRKSLFAATTYERPAFNPSVYGNMSSLRSETTTRSPLASPFYDGVTRYGGASAAPLNYARQLERRAQLLTKRVPTTERKETPSDTQWIQNILKTYSNPLGASQRREANKYMLENKELREQLRNPYQQIGTPIRMQMPCTTKEELQRRKQAQLIPMKELVVPRVVEMMALKQHVQEATVSDPPNTITHQPIKYTPPAQQQHQPHETMQSLDSKQTTKMKPKLNRARGELSAKDREMYSPAVPLELPNVKLPEMAAFPKFDLNLPYTSSSSTDARSIVRREPSTQSSRSSPVRPRPPPVTTLPHPPNDTGANARRSEGREKPFVFSATNIIGSMISNPSAISRKRFSFVLPQLLNERSSGGSETAKASFQQLKAVNANKWTCDVCKVLNEQHLAKCFACKSSKSATPSKSVAAAAPPSFQQLKAVNANKWICDVCMVPNEEDLAKCVACESKKPAPKTAAPPSFQQLKAVNANKWTCDVCMVPNEQDVVKCVACESKKPAPKSTAPPSFQQLKAVNANKWTCDVCMVPNEQDVVKCVACESKKPAPKSTAPPSFQQLKAVNANKWTCDVCMVPNEQDVVKCVACESKKPAPKTAAPPSFQQLKAVNANKWTCDVCMVPNEQDVVKCVACESKKPAPKPTAPPSFQQLKAVNANKWTCDVCMVPNEQDVAKCVACESKKPAPKSTAPPSFQQLKAVNANKWTCEVCMVPNEQDVVKCVACESKKPAPKTSAPPSFQQLKAVNANKWTCDVCMVPNEQDVAKCVACESKKPTPKSAAPSNSAVKVNFGQVPLPAGTNNNHSGRDIGSAVRNAGGAMAFARPAQSAVSRSNGPAQRQQPEPVAKRVRAAANATAAAAIKPAEVITISDDSEDDTDSVCEVVVTNSTPATSVSSGASTTEPALPAKKGSPPVGLFASVVVPPSIGTSTNGTGSRGTLFTFGSGGTSSTFETQTPSQVPSAPPTAVSGGNLFSTPHITATQSDDACGPSQNNIQRTKRPLSEAIGSSNNGNHSGVNQADAAPKPFSFSASTVPNFNFSAPAPMESTAARAPSDRGTPVFQFGGLSQPNPLVKLAEGDNPGQTETSARKLKLRATRRL
ncbi:nuclear pore complex protein Nup153 [Anopheles ziemanni]|uniref:nuclear pore complex protein Nup153 n=1 Tax=Anopheles ziemanni TaxID=345580 RepID=UPI002658FC0C|nr:nuclear pore complex protein Nup153 isoform X2 [Anopheles coustani]XP_058175733.1 nuclear pore complex protein Nup153 [Anopheles ziemanni]